MKIININNRKKKEGKERSKRITDQFALVCELEWVEIEVLWLRKAVAARRHGTTRSVTTVTVMHLDSAWQRSSNYDAKIKFRCGILGRVPYFNSMQIMIIQYWVSWCELNKKWLKYLR